jgi:hypothetical protein
MIINHKEIIQMKTRKEQINQREIREINNDQTCKDTAKYDP